MTGATTILPYSATAPNSSGAVKRGMVSKLFRRFWILAIAILILNLGGLFGLGNLNALEKAVFLLAGGFLFLGSPPNRVSIAGMAVIIVSIVGFGLASTFFAFSWGRVFSAIAGLFAITIFFLVSPSAQDRVLILRSIAWAVPVILIYGMVLHLVFGTPLFMQDHTGASRLGGGATIPAYLAAAAYGSAVAAAQMFAFTRRPGYFLLVFLCVFVCFLSGTRMPSLVAAASSFAVLFFALRGGAARTAFVVLGLIATAAFLLTVGDQLLIRLTSQSTSSRTQLWDAVLQWADYYPWRGVGFGHQIMLVPPEMIRLTRTVAAHNEYVRLAAELGYLGAGLFVIGLFMAFYGAVIRQGKADTFLALVIIGLYFMYAYSDNVLSVTYCLFGPLAYAIGSGLRPDQLRAR
jgi:O-antigen ligase